MLAENKRSSLLWQRFSDKENKFLRHPTPGREERPRDPRQCSPAVENINMKLFEKDAMTDSQMTSRQTTTGQKHKGVRVNKEPLLKGQAQYSQPPQ
jgi:hypothetical protein